MEENKPKLSKQQKGQYKNCLQCNKQFYVQLNVIKKGKGKYCSKFCYFQQRKLVYYKNCIICKLSFKKSSKEGVNYWQTKKYCSRRCYGKAILKENHPRWNPLSDENFHIRTSKKNRIWAKEVKRRDEYICQICGEKGGKLRSHHIKTFLDYPELRLDINNGITICVGCEYRWVFRKEQEWESYFNFNLQNRGFLII